MLIQIQRLFFCAILFFSCNTGKLEVKADLPTSLKEVSAIETTSDSDLLWVIEDAGNKNHVYGLNEKGEIIKDLAIKNSDNVDWEDLTSDASGNLYIGDFGNNSGKRETFVIYKVSHPEQSTNQASSKKITFKLPKGMKSKNFEGFFLFNNSFYLFSKETKKVVLIKVPNQIGNQTSEFVAEFNLKGKHNLITSADISKDGKTVILLNHDKVWKLTGYQSDNFFEKEVKSIPFEYSSQMEGICFKTNRTLYITDESHGKLGSNLYEFKLKI